MSRPSWEQIRNRNPEVIKSQVAEALERIRMTPDGERLENYLIDVVTGVPPANVSDGALRDFEGQKRLARNLLNLMNGMNDGGRTSSGSTSGGSNTSGGTGGSAS